MNSHIALYYIKQQLTLSTMSASIAEAKEAIRLARRFNQRFPL